MKRRTLITGLAAPVMTSWLSAEEKDSFFDDPVFDMLRVVEDPDGFTNLRTKPSVDASIAGKVTSGSIVAVEHEPGAKWCKLAFHEAGDQDLYIHASRLKSLKSWKHHQVKHNQQHDRVSIKVDTLEVTAHSTPFVASEHKITKSDEGFLLVDGESPWGTDGTLPRTGIKLEATLGGKPIHIPSSATKNLYQPNTDSIDLLTPGSATDHAVVLMFNSDGAGGYVIAWAFKNGQYAGRAALNPY